MNVGIGFVRIFIVMRGIIVLWYLVYEFWYIMIVLISC